MTVFGSAIIITITSIRVIDTLMHAHTERVLKVWQCVLDSEREAFDSSTFRCFVGISVSHALPQTRPQVAVGYLIFLLCGDQYR